MVVGELDGPASERVRTLARVLAPCAPIVVTDNFRGAAWSKLAINCTITTLGALTGETLGQMLADPAVRRLFLRIYGEVVETAEGLGVKLEKVAADPKLLYLAVGSSWPKRMIKDLLVRMVGRKYAKLRSSSLQSLERGRRTEVESLNGYVVRQAARIGLAVPCNEALVRMIHEIEEKARPICRENLREMLGLLKSS
jgi:2-dehydropantoate 2-reductase